MNGSKVDFEDVQGLVCFGYGRMTSASYALVRVKDRAAARAWFGSIPVSNAVDKPREEQPNTALQVAFTAPGLRVLGVPESVIEGFSHEFRAGMAQESRSRQLGDVAANAPEYWDWGGPGKEPHAVVMFFANPDYFDGFVEKVTCNGWSEAFEEPHWLRTEDIAGFEPFGFRDGISQPKIDWKQLRQTPCDQLDYTNMAALGEFLLGYRNEYGKFTERPLLTSDATTAGLLPANDLPEKKDLGRNGTYLVLRQLRQDVRAFWQFMDQHAGASQAELAAAMVGRTTDGCPLAPIQEERIPGIGEKDASQNQFTFDQDPAGIRCPFGAHIRRANPRNTDFPERPANIVKKLITMIGFGPNGFRDDLMSSVRFHRILRRGREYGPKLEPAAALAPAPANDPERGLHFVSLNANISRQFEFLQNAWIASTKFSGLTGESDPLLGNREPVPGCPVTSDFNMPQDGALRRRVSGLPQFVTVRGGAYFFLPSLRALRYIAGGG